MSITVILKIEKITRQNYPALYCEKRNLGMTKDDV